MKLTERIKTEVLEVYDAWLESYLSGDVETYDSYLDDACRFIGSTNNEEFLSRKEATEFFRVTADQFAGKMQLKNETKTVEAFGELLFLTHAFDCWFPGGADWLYYGRFRCTSVLRHTKDGWRFIYQHFSTPDSKAQEGETIGYDQISAENLQLREAIKRRTVELEEKNRELAIEAALERIRAQVTAMTDSSELLDIVVTMRTEFVKLGHEAHYFWHMRWLPETYKKAMTSGDGTRIGMVMTLPRNIHGKIPLLAAWEQSNDPTVVYAMDPETAVDYVDKMVSLGDFQQVDPQAPGPDDIRHIGGLTFVMARTTHGEIGFSLPGVVREPPKAAVDTLVRFAGVFDLAYRRFEDLQKAEAQAREAEIELALERVRARTMAMHQSDELKEVIEVVYRQLVHLGVPVEHAGFILDYKERDDMHIWLADQNAVFPEIVLPYFDCAHWNSFLEAKKTGGQFFANRLDFEEKNNFYKDLFQFIPEIPEEAKAHYFTCPALAISTVLLDNIGLYIENYRGIPYSEEENSILLRFGKVFQQTYSRFLDLQKAEAQAREAQIMASMERVRAATMAMHHSGELSNVLSSLFEQFDILGINPSHAVLTLIDKEKNTLNFRTTGTRGYQVEAEQEVDLKVADAWVDTTEKWKKSSPNAVNVNEYPPEVLPDVWEVYKDILSAIPENARPEIRDFPNGLFITEGYCRFGYIGFAHNRGPTEEEKEIVKRIAAEFGTLYQRFLDLQKAEAQAREAEIQLALERVRARSMAMQNTDELHEVLSVLFRQFDHLGIQPVNVFLSLFDRENRTLTYRASGKSGTRRPGKQVVQVDSMEPLKALYDKWLHDNSDSVEVIFYPKEVLPELFGIFSETFAAMPEADRMGPDDFPEGGYSMAGYTPFGYLGYDHQRAATEEEKEILSRFCLEFTRVYQRFLDIQKAEAQAREAQIEAALEKIRSRSLGMQNSGELQDVVQIVAEKIQELGVIVDPTGVLICTYPEGTKDVIHWTYSPAARERSKPYFMPYFEHPIWDEAWESKNRGDAWLSKTYSKGVKNKFLRTIFTRSDSDYSWLPEDYKQWQLDSPVYTLSFAWGKNSALCVPNNDGTAPTEAQKDILIRFARVFEQSYVRFLDLQKSEEQAREAQIQLSLERLRSKAMSMQQSDELHEVLAVLFEQFDVLGIRPMSTHMTILDLENNTFTFRETGKFGNRSFGEHTFALDAMDTWKDMVESWQKTEPFTINRLHFPKENLPQVWEVFRESFASMPEESRIRPGDYPDGIYHTAGKHPFGYIGMNQVRPPTEEEEQIVIRFANEFGRVYQRFLDLQKAEAQSREAKIETALEKVRARTMGMQHSDELPDVALVLFNEVRALGVPAWSSGFNILAEDKKSAAAWMSSEGTLQKPFTLRLYGEASFEEMGAFVRGKNPFLVQELGGKALEAHYDYMKTFPDLQTIFEDIQAAGLSLPTYQINHLCKFTHGFLLFITYEQVPGAHEIFRRFTTVFEQTYTRFLDLSLKEKQAVELMKEKQRLEQTLKHLRETQTQLVHAEKMASLGELTAGIAHEIQNPLNFVNNFSEVSNELLEEMAEELEKGDLSEVRAIVEDLKQNLDKITHHGKRADGIVKGMLQHSRSSDGKKQPTDLNALAEEYLRLAYHGLRAKDKGFNATLETEFDEAMEAVALVPQDIGRVLLNLLTNAFHAVSERKQKEAGPYTPTVWVRTHRSAGGVELTVRDNGGGIPEAIREKIFQPFFTTKPTGQGTGLGLSMSYDIATKGHGGKLNVSSKEGEGTTFTLVLPDK
jgi:signal transduction histidine kinase/ketosteroid isomerase-like protein